MRIWVNQYMQNAGVGLWDKGVLYDDDDCIAIIMLVTGLNMFCTIASSGKVAEVLSSDTCEWGTFCGNKVFAGISKLREARLQ